MAFDEDLTFGKRIKQYRGKFTCRAKGSGPNAGLMKHRRMIMSGVRIAWGIQRKLWGRAYFL